MAKSETLSETRQKFEEWAREHFKYDFWPVRWSAAAESYIDIEDGLACGITQSAWQAFEAGRLQGLEEAAKVADKWANSANCDEHDNDPCCHIRTGTGIAAAIREKAND